MVTEESPEVDKKGAELVAQRFRMLEDIAKELAGEVVFPTCFDVTLRLRRELQNPDFSIQNLAGVISVEPLIASKLMRLANSVMYAGAAMPVRDVQGAVLRLGVQVVRSTALAIAMTQIVHAKELAPFTDFTNALWEHTVKSAAIAKVLSKRLTRINPDEAMLAGLVHDLGAFYMLYRAAQYPELKMRPESLKHLIIQWHESIGVTLLNALSLPEDIVDSTIDHDHLRDEVPKLSSLRDVVYVANVLAGTFSEWMYQRHESYDEEKFRAHLRALEEEFGDLLPDADKEAQELLDLFR